MHIGCLFGSFDPPHVGHIAIAEHMLKARKLDQVWMVVTPQNPFKQHLQLSDDSHRLAMVRLAVQENDKLVASGFEIDMPRPSYTSDSLRFMRHRWPGNTFDLIIGSDNLATLHDWKDPEEILEYHTVLVYPRTGFDEHKEKAVYSDHKKVILIPDCPMLKVSSTQVRNDLKAWKPVEAWVSPDVLRYIRQHRLYH